MAPTKRSAKSDATPTSKTEEKAAEANAAVIAKEEEEEEAAAGVVESTEGKLPLALQFPLTVALNFALSSLGRMIISQVSNGELESLTRSQDTWGEVALVTGWRMFELAVGWFGKLDSLEAGAASILAHGPTFYLLAAFYNLTPTTALSALAVDVLSVALPFYLVRPLSSTYGSPTKADRDILDIPMQLLTTILSTGIYTVTLVLSLRFLMPRILVVYFNGLPSLEPAYSASYTDFIPVTILFGLAASTFIFAPFAKTGKAEEDAKIEQFDPVSASLGQTVCWNFWGYTAKTKVLIRRTAAAVLLSAVGTYLACTKAMYGIGSTGAAAYASLWAVAALFAGVGLGLVGGD
ncbi:hypothetical protein J3459_007581 [Metarhizium acridum]|uniref:Uncharacterized protein n=1 Tax=Metarhizium acridum (strain CQMa 102) TaxID=655827 RepID=E9DRK4_METAQ|nr:uncharacterized protein MAC_00373 [Metarhizium acridum CQMa 102]EFY93882.1 hypothetical protein MAC_00373 [Metarhizium acridum CQMa 102]KAG8416489.1 hypothetical protein J3458_007073 [Metarhizium acridum]KAG8426996.1 hypothetical protein J3459_007619 [Metarhizium acridum]KAG8427034.1 hypothetical protein J3459_007581 [Metarhizium acridum]